jgi:hypothetical protein
VNEVRDRVGLVHATMAMATAVLVCACGHTTHRAAAPVKLRVSAPADDSRSAAGTATISGFVSPPTARVLVTGRAVKSNSAGAFTAAIPLVLGTNLIDVIASAPYARPAMTTVRVIRYVLITVPDVTGESPAKAAASIRGTGLRAELQGDGNPFSFLLPLPQQVCGQSPAGGTRVQPGTTVSLHIGKVCT